MAIRIITDSSADFPVSVAAQLGVNVIPMSIQFGDSSYLSGIDLDNGAFYRMLQAGSENPATAQPAPAAFLEIFEQAKATGDEVVAILLSGVLSGTAQTACMARDMCGYEPVYIVDSRSATAGIQLLVQQACQMRDAGATGAEIARELEQLQSRVRIFAVIDTLEYLRRGGRVSNLAANLGTATKLKPTISVRGGAVDIVGKSFGISAAVKHMVKLIAEHPMDPDFPVYFLYTDDKTREELLLPRLEEDNMLPRQLNYCCVGPTIGTHIGPGALGIAYVEKLP